MIQIAPSLLAANSAELGQEVVKLQNAQADLIHFDVMDGHFVPNITFGAHILKDLKKHTTLPFDVHLMVNDPSRFIPWFAKAGADFISFHLEASPDPLSDIALIRQYGVKAGITLKPDTNMALLKTYASAADMILIMAVEPGFGGQKFREDTVRRILAAKEFIGKQNILLEVDGGITPLTAQAAKKAGADILVAGTAVFRNGTYAQNIKDLREV